MSKLSYICCRAEEGNSFILLYFCLSSHYNDYIQKPIIADECVYHVNGVQYNDKPPQTAQKALGKVETQLLLTYCECWRQMFSMTWPRLCRWPCLV